MGCIPRSARQRLSHADIMHFAGLEAQSTRQLIRMHKRTHRQPLERTHTNTHAHRKTKRLSHRKETIDAEVERLPIVEHFIAV